jgi:hypothetical protein
MKNRIAATALLACLAIFSSGCAPADRHFWYPVKLMHVKCTNYEGDVYLMTNSIGWRSWPYTLDKASKREINLMSDICVYKTIRELPVHKRRVQDMLTAEQKQYIVEGF